MPDASSEEAEAELDARVERDAEPEHQERSAMAKLAALREQFGRSAYPEADAALEAENADLCSKLEAAEGNAREQRDALLHFGQNWQRRAGAAERRIERARDVLERRAKADAADGVSHTTAVQVALAILEPANAEGIASEGGSAERSRR